MLRHIRMTEAAVSQCQKMDRHIQLLRLDVANDIREAHVVVPNPLASRVFNVAIDESQGIPQSPPSTMNPGAQYSHSSHCLSTQSMLSDIRSSIAVLVLALGHLRFSISIGILTYPRSCAAFRTALWSVLSSLGMERI